MFDSVVSRWKVGPQYLEWRQQKRRSWPRVAFVIVFCSILDWSIHSINSFLQIIVLYDGGRCLNSWCRSHFIVWRALARGIAGLLVTYPIDPTHWTRPQRPGSWFSTLPSTDRDYVRPARRVCSLTDTKNQNKNAIFCVVYCMRQKNFISTKSR